MNNNYYKCLPWKCVWGGVMLFNYGCLNFKFKEFWQNFRLIGLIPWPQLTLFFQNMSVLVQKMGTLETVILNTLSIWKKSMFCIILVWKIIWIQCYNPDTHIDFFNIDFFVACIIEFNHKFHKNWFPVGNFNFEGTVIF